MARSAADPLAFLLALAAGGVGLAWAAATAARIRRRPRGDAAMSMVAGAIADGARAFLRREYLAVAWFVAGLSAVLFILGGTGHPQLTTATAVCFLAGAATSLLSGYAGMRVAVASNVRTAAAASSSLAQAFGVAFDGGSVVGFAVASLGLLGLAAALFAFGDPARPDTLDAVNGFALGASSVALFARVAGGIYTKGADIAADLVGKVEAHIPEDDARNPAVIADNVGDNVGDVAGMGADLLESYAGSMVAAIAIAAADAADRTTLLLPLALAASGLVACLLGTMVVRSLSVREPQRAMRLGTWAAGGAFAVMAWAATLRYGRPELFGAVATGLVLAVAVGLLTEHATGANAPAVATLAESATAGPAPAVIEGLALGMASATVPVALIAAGIIAAFAFGGLYGIALAAVGMLSTIALSLAVDAYGPIADNAGGIAEMARMPPAVRERTDRLDAAGNTTAAVGKGIAIGSAALTALALFAAYAAEARLQVIDLVRPTVVAGLLAGGVLPFLFSAQAMRAVGRTAREMVAEVRRQFAADPRILTGLALPDYARCVDISARAALARMVLPGLAAVALPLGVGLTLGREVEAGLLAGAMVSGLSLAIASANAGGAMDNAKKRIEGGAHGGKGGAPHAAAVIADTVGDPLKDTAGPSLNILIKLMTVVALVFVPLFRP